MKIICEKCEKVIDRDKIIEGQVVEKYENIYGTRCPHCGVLSKPVDKPQLVKDAELKRELLIEEVRGVLRKKLRR